MKNNKLIYLFMLAVTLVISSCTDETGITTGDDRDSFTGNWSCSEKSKEFGNSIFAVSISKVGDNDSISIRNFYNLGSNYAALGLVSGNAITIPFQSIDGIMIQGSGLMSNSSKFELDYFTNDAGVKDTVADTFTK